MADVARILREGVDAFNAADMERFVSLFDPEAELISVFTAALSGRRFNGHEGLREWRRDVDETWSDMRIEAETVFERGDDALIHLHLSARGRLSGVEVVTPIAYVVGFRGDLIVRLQTYTDRRVALEDFGGLDGAVEVPLA